MANTYTTIKTNAGLALETAAQAGGDKITLTQMAVGDGGGNTVTPAAAQTALVREQVRVSLNAIAVDPDNSNQFTAEAIIPASAGGFTMREAGLYTADGVLFAVANLPQVYKPSSAEGSFGQVVITMTFQAANSEEVNLSVDENVSVATRLWVENYVIPEHVFRGGTTGQFLAKSANDDGAWTWVDPSASVQVLVDTVEEDQTLAAGQTAITLSKVTANGLGVFINGVRLRDDEWSKIDDTHISLNSARNDGDKITLLQNEQTGYSDVLRADRNLSDVDNADAALANLSGLSTKGGRMEGLFAVDSGVMYANGPAGTDRGVILQTSGSDRFSIIASSGAESGSNSGSSFHISRYGDDGKVIDTPLRIDRATGEIDVSGNLSVAQNIHASGAVAADTGLTVVNGNASGNYATFGTMPDGDYAAVRINPPASYGVNLLEVGKGNGLSFCIQSDGGSIFEGYANFQGAATFSGAASFGGDISRTLGVSDSPGNTGNAVPNTAWVDKYYAPSSWVSATFGTQSWISSTFATQSALSNESSRAQGAETSLNNGKADKNAPAFTGGVDITGSDGTGKYLRMGDPLPSGAYAAFQMNLPSTYGVNPVQIDKGGVQIFAIGTNNNVTCAGGGTFGGGLSSAGDVNVGSGKSLYTDIIAAKSAGSVTVSSPFNLNGESWLNKNPSDQPGACGSHLVNAWWVDNWYAPKSSLQSEVSRAQSAESSLQGQISSVNASTNIRVNGQFALSSSQSSQYVLGLIINSSGNPAVWYGNDSNKATNLELATNANLQSEVSRAQSAESGKVNRSGDEFTGDVSRSQGLTVGDYGGSLADSKFVQDTLVAGTGLGFYFGANGAWSDLPGGLRIQTGSSGSGSGGMSTVQFSTPFKNGCFSVVICEDAADDGWTNGSPTMHAIKGGWDKYGFSAISVKLENGNFTPTSGLGYTWIAIGR